MKKLVIGASGHLGANLSRSLLAEKYEVKALVRRTSNLNGLTGLDIELVYGDVLDSTSLARAMVGCDAVFHLGAPTILEPEIYRIIMEGTKHVLEEAHRSGIAKLIYTSSIVTIGYSSKPNIILDETFNEFTPASPYHMAKFDAEKLVLNFSQETGLPVIIVNPTTTIGPLDYRVTPSNLPIQQCIDQGLPFVFDSGLTIAHVADVARGHILALLHGRTGQRYILGGNQITMQEYFKLICKLCHRPQPYFKIPRVAMLALGIGFSLLKKVGLRKVPFNYSQAVQLVGKYGWYSSSKAADELGYTWRPLADAVDSYIQWKLTDRIVDHD